MKKSVPFINYKVGLLQCWQVESLFTSITPLLNSNLLCLAVLFSAFCFPIFTSGQTFTTVATGLTNPLGISRDMNGNLFVAEAGSGTNDGRIMMITPLNQLCPVVTGLSSYSDMGSISGPYRTYEYANGLMKVVIGDGKDTTAGSIMTFDISNFHFGDPPFAPSDAINVLPVQPWVLGMGFGDSNIYSAAWDSAGNAYIVDASTNMLYKSDTSGHLVILDTFQDIKDTVFGSDTVAAYVPTIIINNPANLNEFYLANFTGWPFLNGLASVVKISTTGAITPYASGLTQLTEIEADSATGDIFALQYGFYDTLSFNWHPNSATIVRIHPGGTMIDTIVTGFGPSAGMVRDTAGGFFVTCQMSGSVLHASPVLTGLHSAATECTTVAYPNPFTDDINVHFCLNNSSTVGYMISDMTGRVVYSEQGPVLGEGQHTFNWSAATAVNGQKVSPGIYLLTLTCGQQQSNLKLVMN